MTAINSNIPDEVGRVDKPSAGTEAGPADPHPHHPEHFGVEDFGSQANAADDGDFAEYVHIQNNHVDAHQQLDEEVSSAISDDTPVIGGNFHHGSNSINEVGVQRLIKIGKISHKEGQEIMICAMAYHNSRDEHIKFNCEKFFHSKIGDIRFSLKRKKFMQLRYVGNSVSKKDEKAKNMKKSGKAKNMKKKSIPVRWVEMARIPDNQSAQLMILKLKSKRIRKRMRMLQNLYSTHHDSFDRNDLDGWKKLREL